ncbi:MAG: dihydropteridine reductase [Ruminococcaceae bacterium]|nr:dihydropteridine reductase [Oscillospiraceae bacterium]
MNKTDQEFLVSKIRAQYVEKTPTELDELKVLDNQVKRPANVFAYLFGSVAALIMGAGMSLVMTDLAATLGIVNPMLWGVIIGAVGLVAAVVNYPIYKKILGARRRKYASVILALSDNIMKVG